MKIAIVQFEPIRGDIEKNIEIHIMWIKQAIKYNADLIAFPELSLVYLATVLNSVSGIDSDLKKLADIALNYNMTTLMVNYVGQSGGYECAGKSFVWDKNGKLLKQLGDKDEEAIICDTVTNQIIPITLITNKQFLIKI